MTCEHITTRNNPVVSEAVMQRFDNWDMLKLDKKTGHDF